MARPQLHGRNARQRRNDLPILAFIRKHDATLDGIEERRLARGMHVDDSSPSGDSATGDLVPEDRLDPGGAALGGHHHHGDARVLRRQGACRGHRGAGDAERRNPQGLRDALGEGHRDSKPGESAGALRDRDAAEIASVESGVADQTVDRRRQTIDRSISGRHGLLDDGSGGIADRHRGLRRRALDREDRSRRGCDGLPSVRFRHGTCSWPKGGQGESRPRSAIASTAASGIASMAATSEEGGGAASSTRQAAARS